MHPPGGGDTFLHTPPRSNPSFNDRDAIPIHTPPQQMTYFLASEEDIDSIESSVPSSTTHQPRSRGQPKHGMFGVESLETSVNSVAQDHDFLHKSLRRPSLIGLGNMARPSSRKSEDSSIQDSTSSSLHSSPHASRDNSPADQRRSPYIKHSSSQSFTPLSLQSPPSGTIPSFMNSRRNSAESLFTDDATSQAIISSEEDDKDNMSSQIMDSGSIPQLVMPSIKMPSRRPFTDQGKNMGRLKVLIAGDSGVGKTSLIKAIVQICEDIVHVDPLTSTTVETKPRIPRKSSKSRGKARKAELSTAQIAEVYASTRPYPSWWSEVDDAKILRRRKSMGDTVLERNLCFVDTPGYGRGTSCMESITPVINYIEAQFTKMSTLANVADGEFISMMSGNGGSQVDVVFYTIRRKIRPVDVEYIRRLSLLSNVIPIISQCDTLSADEIATLKSAITSELQNSNVSIFSFGKPQPAVYAVSTIASQDEDVMDASILMSPDYVQPMVSTELTHLVSDVFTPDSVCFLRHSASTKFLKWQKQTSSPGTVSLPELERSQINFTPSLSLGASASSISSGSARASLLPPVGTASTYALARIADHTRREEHLAQVRLSNWAYDLQQSLHNERARYEALCRGERAIWLTGRLSECVRDGTLIAVAPQDSNSRTRWSNQPESAIQTQTYWRPNGNKTKGESDFNKTDPLGLILLNARFKRTSWIALQVVGSLGVVGGLAILLGVGKNWFCLSEQTRASFLGEWDRLGWSRWIMIKFRRRRGDA